MEKDFFEIKRQAQEDFILLLIGRFPNVSLSVERIECYIFSMCKHCNNLLNLFHMEYGWKEDIVDLLECPYFREDDYYVEQNMVRITENGLKHYEELFERVVDKIKDVLFLIGVTRRTYDGMTTSKVVKTLKNYYDDFK